MEVLKVAYKKRKRRHKTKWNYKRIVIASTGLAVLVIALTVVISISGKDKSKDSSYNSGIVADAAQNQSDKDNNLNTIPQKTMQMINKIIQMQFQMIMSIHQHKMLIQQIKRRIMI